MGRLEKYIISKHQITQFSIFVYFETIDRQVKGNNAASKFNIIKSKQHILRAI